MHADVTQIREEDGSVRVRAALVHGESGRPPRVLLTCGAVLPPERAGEADQTEARVRAALETLGIPQGETLPS